MLRLRFFVFALPLVAVAALTVAANRPSPAEGVIDPACSSSLPCIEYDNNGSGPGVRGVGLGGNGLSGEAQFNSTSASNGKAGVIGADISTSGAFDAGVKGTSTRGIGVLGVSTSGAAIVGSSTSGPALLGTSSTREGVRGVSTSGAGVIATSSSGAGVSATSNTGMAIDGSSGAGIGANIIGGYSSGKTSFPALSIVGNNCAGPCSAPPDLIDACAPGDTSCGGGSSAVFTVFHDGSISSSGANAHFGSTLIQTSGLREGLRVVGSSSGYPVMELDATVSPQNLIELISSTDVNIFYVDDSGNVTITGTIKTGGSCSSGCAKPASTSGYHVVSYAPRESVPTMEDTGEGQLVNGSAYVRIDPALANVIDRTTNYVVLITPEGDSRGLYVTQKTPAGFAVRENQGGRSTLAFGYRIVAKPYGSREPRLPMVYTHRAQTRLSSGLIPDRSHG